MSINSYIARQFGKPEGFGGKIITAVMNRQNRPMYEETERKHYKAAPEPSISKKKGRYWFHLCLNRLVSRVLPNG